VLFQGLVQKFPIFIAIFHQNTKVSVVMVVTCIWEVSISSLGWCKIILSDILCQGKTSD